MRTSFSWIKNLHIRRVTSPLFWFFIGFTFAGVLLTSAVAIYYQHAYKDKVIPGVFVDNQYVGEKTREEVKAIFEEKNNVIGQKTFEFSYGNQIATVSAKELSIGYNTDLIADQSLTLAKSPNIVSNFSILINSYINGTFLDSSYTYDEERIKQILAPMDKELFVQPINAEFRIEDNRVVTFKQSSNGRALNYDTLQEEIRQDIVTVVKRKDTNVLKISIPVDTIEPEVTTEEANEFGIVEAIGVGTSRFAHSIPNRVHNVALAASRVNGILIAPGEEFSFAKHIGDVSRATGYKEAYVISGGKTILGDGGGVCQVSTTLFRAALNAGLPITERQAHAYRVGYYEQDSGPGIDATVYIPTVDFKFKNDTKNHILIQSVVDTTNLTMSYTIYGKKDGREVTVTSPIVTGVVPPPPTVYQDDPNLPKGVEKQVDYAAPGARVSFSRTVVRDGKVLATDTFNSHYRAWAAVFLRGTKE